MGAIGVGGRGTEDLKWFRNDPTVQMVANCDIREDRRESVKSMIPERHVVFQMHSTSHIRSRWEMHGAAALLVQSSITFAMDVVSSVTPMN